AAAARRCGDRVRAASKSRGRDRPCSSASGGMTRSGTRVAVRPCPMNVTRVASWLLLVLSTSIPVFALAPAAQEPPPPPLWDIQSGAAFGGTSGNTDTTTTGADFSANRRGLVWLLEAAAKAVRTSTNDETTAERFLGDVRGKRKLTEILGLSTG